MEAIADRHPCAWCGCSRADQFIGHHSDDDEPLCDACWERTYGDPPDTEEVEF